MNHVTTAHLGYRSRLFSDRNRAARFAKMIQAQGSFTAVEIVACSGGHFVRYAPASTSATSRLRSRVQRPRSERGTLPAFTFVREQGFYACHSHATGETYEVTAEQCDCADFRFRCQRNGLSCKHQVALGVALKAGSVGEYETIPARRESSIGWDDPFSRTMAHSSVEARS